MIYEGWAEVFIMRLVFAIISFFIFVSCSGGASGVISEACEASNRSAASSSLCSCIQRAANKTLRKSEQSKAAEFFADPQLAHDTKISKSWSNDAFWKRYKNFSETATRMCRKWKSQYFFWTWPVMRQNSFCIWIQNLPSLGQFDRYIEKVMFIQNL